MVDEGVLRAAERYLEKPVKRKWVQFLPWFVGAGAAAVLVLVLTTAYPTREPSREAAITIQNSGPVSNRAFVREDVNQDGRVDILDAFELARALKRGETAGRWDLNGDGVVDERDVTVIAARAVKLEKRS
jgi:hypothetical protein